MPQSTLANVELLKEAYATHLNSFPWDMYLTQTFKLTRRDGSNAVSAVWKCLQDVFSSNRAFLAVEPYYLDGIHLHGLLRIPEWHDTLPGRVHSI